MNNNEDSQNEEIESTESDRRDDIRELKFIDKLIDKATQRLEDDSFEPRMQDALKAIQLKEKVAKTSEKEKTFWGMIDELRQEELTKHYPEEPVSLETQIQNTILRLKYEVKNGILPLKIITDTFNQSKSKESQLTYHRIGKLLSTMGFRKAKTHAGTSAILWDDAILSRNGFPDVKKDEKLPSASPAKPASPASPDFPAVTLCPEGLLPPKVCGLPSS